MNVYDNDGKDSQVKCNVVLIGKTGTGKSSFANYIFNDDKFKTSIGKRGTDWDKNFQQYAINYNGVKINIFDSVGLEEQIIGVWKDRFKSFLNQKCDSSILSANELMHIIFYVINASSGRAEDLIAFKDLLRQYDIPVTVVLTNCDTASREKIDGIKEVCINNGFFDVIEVCSVKKNTRRGSTEPFGREEALHRIIDASAVKVGKELSLVILDGFVDKLYEIESEIERGIDESDISVFNLDSLDEFDFDAVLGDFENLEVEDFIPNYYKNYISFMKSIDAKFDTTSAFDELFAKINNVLESLDVDKISFVEKFNEKINALDDDDVSIFGKAWALLSLGYKALRIKSTIKEGIEEIFAKLHMDLRTVKNDFEHERIWEEIKKRQANVS